MLIAVWHYSPNRNLTILEPRTPQHPSYNDHAGIYVAPTLDTCKFWAETMTKEGYHNPSYYIYRGLIQVKHLRKLVAVDDDCEKFHLQKLDLAEVHQNLQLVAVKSIHVTLIYKYDPQTDQLIQAD